MSDQSRPKKGINRREFLRRAGTAAVALQATAAMAQVPTASTSAK